MSVSWIFPLSMTSNITEPDQQAIQYEDTFTQTIIMDVGLVAIFVLIFSIIKTIFPSIYMPLVNTSRGKKWFSDIVHIPLATFAQRGNWNLFLGVF